MVRYDAEYDLAVLAPRNGTTPISEVTGPQYPNNSITHHHIDGTLTHDGLSQLQAEGHTFRLRGRSSCNTLGLIQNTNATQLTTNCQYVQEDQVKWDASTQAGDSGGLVYSEPYGSENKRYASHMHSGSPMVGNGFGTAGYALRNNFGYWWDDL